MSASQVTFNARYSTELILEATRTFRDYRFGRYGPIFGAACLINAAGFALFLWFSPRANAFGSVSFVVSTAFIAFIVVSGPAWLLYQYFLEPARRAAILGQVLPPHLSMSIGPTMLWANIAGREIAIPINVVVETNALFLVVLSPLEFAIVPKSHLPTSAFQVLHGKSRVSAV